MVYVECAKSYLLEAREVTCPSLTVVDPSMTLFGIPKPTFHCLVPGNFGNVLLQNNKCCDFPSPDRVNEYIIVMRN